jgi:phytanoyl-CoA hydroxylase
MLNADQLKQFDHCGFLKGDVVLSDEQVEMLRLELDLVMEGKTVKKPLLERNMLDDSQYGMSITNKETVVQIVNIWMASDAFLQHAGNARRKADLP